MRTLSVVNCLKRLPGSLRLRLLCLPFVLQCGQADTRNSYHEERLACCANLADLGAGSLPVFGFDRRDDRIGRLGRDCKTGGVEQDDKSISLTNDILGL